MHHHAAQTWFAQQDQYATCPITQGALIRLAIREGATATDALDVLGSVTSRPGHRMWTDDLGYDQAELAGVFGHRQVTDAYLAGLARHRGARLASLDRALVALHPDVGVLVAT